MWQEDLFESLQIWMKSQTGETVSRILDKDSKITLIKLTETPPVREIGRASWRSTVTYELKSQATDTRTASEMLSKILNALPTLEPINGKDDSGIMWQALTFRILTNPSYLFDNSNSRGEKTYVFNASFTAYVSWQPTTT